MKNSTYVSFKIAKPSVGKYKITFMKDVRQCVPSLDASEYLSIPKEIKTVLMSCFHTNVSAGKAHSLVCNMGSELIEGFNGPTWTVNEVSNFFDAVKKEQDKLVSFCGVLHNLKEEGHYVDIQLDNKIIERFFVDEDDVREIRRICFFGRDLL
jgi:hypothetical protein